MNSLFPLRTLLFCFRIVLKTARFIIRNYSKYYLEDKWKVKPMLVMLSPNSKQHHLWKFFNSQILLPYWYSVLLSVVLLIFHLSAPRFALCPYMHLIFVFLVTPFCLIVHISNLYWISSATQKQSMPSHTP